MYLICYSVLSLEREEMSIWELSELSTTFFENLKALYKVKEILVFFFSFFFNSLKMEPNQTKSE